MHSYTVIVDVLNARRDGVSFQSIQNRHRIGAKGIYLILNRFEALDVGLEEFTAWPPEKVQEAIYPAERSLRKECGLPDFDPIYKKIKESKGRWNVEVAWIDYKDEHPDGYEITQFYEHYNRYLVEKYGFRSVRMAVERNPGEKMYIDWTGDTATVVLRDLGKSVTVHLFLTTLGLSSFIYAECFLDEKLDKFISGVVKALSSYDGVPAQWVPDNLRAAINKHDKDNLILNSLFHDLESFYGVVVLPPPARKPKGKPTVESAVKYSESHILERIKSKEYDSLRDLNEKVREIVAKMNDATRGRTHTRRELFQMYDKPALKPNPGVFCYSDYKYITSIPDNYHVKYDDHYYSVSYTYYHKPAIIRASFTEIVILDENNRVIAKHRRVYSYFPRYSTDPNHMPPAHRFYKEVNERDGNSYRNWAKKFGPYTCQFIDRLLNRADHEQQAYNSCNGLLHTAESYAYERVEDAARRCLEKGVISYSGFIAKLKDKPDADETAAKKTTAALPKHENIRGADYYD